MAITTTRWFFVFATIGFLASQFVISQGQKQTQASNRAELRNKRNILEKILKDYDYRFGPPHVKVDLHLKLFELDVTPDKSKIKVNMWFRYSWCDFRLKWQPEQFGGVNQIIVYDNSINIWTPDISIYNSKTPFPEFEASSFILQANGTVIYVDRNTNFNVSCVDPPLTLSDYPNKIQNCSLTVGSWGFGEEDFQLCCDESITFASDNFRDITDYRVLRTMKPVKESEPFDHNTYAVCKYPIIFERKSASKVNAMVQQRPDYNFG